MSRPQASSPGEVRPFKSKAELTAAENLKTFIARARLENPLAVQDWDAVSWPVAKSSRASASSDGGLQFTLRSANTEDPGFFPEPFMSFAKATVCRYNQRSQQGYSVGSSQVLIAALRVLYDVIRTRGADPSGLTHGDFSEAANRIESLYGSSAAGMDSKLKFISEEIDRHRLTALPIRYKGSITRGPKHDRVGIAAMERRHAMLPHPDSLSALGDISARQDLEDRELIVIRAIDLLVCGGFRLNEVLTLPRNTLIEEAVLDDEGHPALDVFGAPAFRVGLRYWPEKGGHRISQIKWLPTAITDLARRAIRDVLRITEPHVEVAKYQRKNKQNTLLGDPWDAMQSDDLLSTKQVAQAVGLKTDSPCGGSAAGKQFIKLGELPMLQSPKRTNQVSITCETLRKYLWERSTQGNVLNRDVGVLDIADCLFVIPLFFVKRPLECGLRGTVELLKDHVVQVTLTSQANGIQPSIFERHGYQDAFGNPLRMNSHQFRHLLNTLAAEGGVSEAAIARWMGRTNIAQNADYQHVTPLVRAERLRERMMTGAADGPVAEAASKIHDPVRREEFIVSNTRTAHVTDLGFCVHSWDALPCQEDAACESCSEHRFLKGDPESRRRAADDLDKVEALLATAREEDADGTYGVNNWLVAHERKAAALRRILAIHDDPSIPEGTLIQLPQERPTWIFIDERRETGNAA